MTTGEAPAFDDGFRERLADLIAWRRDVRRFRTDPIAPEQVRRLLALAALSPSVGNSQPWRFVLVEDEALRRGARDCSLAANAAAAETYEGERAALYRSLKLEGMAEAPVHIAAFCDEATPVGCGLGRMTMPETLSYSVAGAIATLWLAARAEGLGLGWVSILDPARVHALLGVPASWRLVGYLCLGRPVEEHDDPELVRAGWQDRLPFDEMVLTR
ncbi:5,6-dimethylbenzimidazole synthase [Methylopila turkensis]|uniref:Oxidoreductase n=1 Tax=Methylopila turkensis TaxID=1437816 RepID=A0A9W6N6H9_9HYPH|nr:5,6-dimethylbenzimidazole synthase [Methylopila turkensis]GLK79405.1 oxidoreductase [Methylopila turkensis]